MIAADHMLRLGCLLLGLWGALNALQWWASRKSWRDGGPLGWDLHGLRTSRLVASPVLARLFTAARLDRLVVLQLLTSVALVVTPTSIATPLLLMLFSLVIVLLGLRTHTDGADKMALVASNGMILQAAGLQMGLPALALAGALWVGGQLTIAYVTSGAAKMALPNWRDGSAASAALGSYMHGHRLAHAAARHRGFALCFAWFLMIAEVSFLLAPLTPPAILIPALAGFFLFHLATAVFMGLNTYPWAFLAAYPSMALMAQALRAMIGG